MLGTLVLLLAGCLPSVNPFFTENDLVFDPRLLGEWQTPKDQDDPPTEWQFERGEGKAYKLTVVEKKTKRGEFSAHYFKLGKEGFLDLIPSKCDFAPEQADLVSFAVFPGHLLLRITQMEPELKIAGCDYDWLQKTLEANPKTLSHHKEENSLVLMADTPDLQKFVLAHLGEGELFNKPGVLLRKTASAAPAPEKKAP